MQSAVCVVGCIGNWEPLCILGGKDVGHVGGSADVNKNA